MPRSMNWRLLAVAMIAVLAITVPVVYFLTTSDDADDVVATQSELSGSAAEQTERSVNPAATLPPDAGPPPRDFADGSFAASLEQLLQLKATGQWREAGKDRYVLTIPMMGMQATGTAVRKGKFLRFELGRDVFCLEKVPSSQSTPQPRPEGNAEGSRCS